MTISASIDAYGKIIRSSCMADYLELRALAGDPCRFADLSDQVKDRWPRRKETIQLPGTDIYPYEDDEFSDGTSDDDYGTLHEVVEGAITCIGEREAVLEDDYPFYIRSSRLLLKDGSDVGLSKYVSLLAITSIHAYDLQADLHVDQIFEDILARCLGVVGLTAFNVGSIFRESKQNFERTINRLAELTGIDMDPNSAPRHKNANDDGVDFFGFLDWRDRRSGRWIMIGQATCGSSDTWTQKINEPRPETWSSMTHEDVAPQAFLAVPHHVDHRHHRYLCGRNSRAVVDRLRIVKFMDDLPTDNPTLIRALLTTPVD